MAVKTNFSIGEHEIKNLLGTDGDSATIMRRVGVSELPPFQYDESRRRCRSCGKSFTSSFPLVSCPQCTSTDIVKIGY